MIEYRSFRNSDPPEIADIWRSQPPLHGLMQPVTSSILEQFVFSKPYFDRHGFIVAVDGQQPIGFVHAAFGPAGGGQTLGFQNGVTCMLMVKSVTDQSDVARQLLARSEQYLVEHGARILHGGGVAGLNPFYLGLYGGAELPGILQQDHQLQRLYEAAGYQTTARRLIYRRKLSGFRPLVDHRQIQIRRVHQIEAFFDPPATTWWEACTMGQTERTRFGLHSRDGGPPVGTATFWPIEPLAGRWGVHAVGLLQLEIQPTYRQQGLATYLLGEALRQLRQQGVALAEAHLDHTNLPATALLQKLGFAQQAQGIVMQKTF